MGSIYCHTSAKEGCMIVWVCADHSSAPAAPSLSIEDIDDRWIQFSEYIAPVGQICVAPGQCSPDYIDWFYLIFHPFMSSAQPVDPLR